MSAHGTKKKFGSWAEISARKVLNMSVRGIFTECFEPWGFANVIHSTTPEISFSIFFSLGHLMLFAPHAPIFYIHKQAHSTQSTIMPKCFGKPPMVVNSSNINNKRNLWNLLAGVKKKIGNSSWLSILKKKKQKNSIFSWLGVWKFGNFSWLSV